MKMKLNIFIFRRDLRTIDNIGLLNCEEEKILPIFIFDPEQINDSKNSYFSNNCVQFMIESLIELEENIKNLGGKLYFYYGSPDKVLKEIIEKISQMLNREIKGVYVNKDYTPYSQLRDNKLRDLCEKKNILFIENEDVTINPINSIKTLEGNNYKVFTPYYNNAKKREIKKVNNKKITNWLKLPLKTKFDINLSETNFYNYNPNILHNGGRINGLKQLNKLMDNKNYKNTRDIPSIPTTEMSAYNKFGCISIREFMEKLRETVGLNNGIARQLYFRDFYYEIVYNNPRVFGESYYEKFNNIPWENNISWLNKWKKGLTGYPIIDAGIRQLLITGFMHNRLRMLCASFLIKDLLIDWKIGEKFFAQHLYDYDPSQNNCGWQTVAGTGASSLEWFRVMNPWTQTKKYDSKCEYIKEWVEELREIDNEIILNWDKKQIEINYPKPVVNHEERRIIYLEVVRKSI